MIFLFFFNRSLVSSDLVCAAVLLPAALEDVQKSFQRVALHPRRSQATDEQDLGVSVDWFI